MISKASIFVLINEEGKFLLQHRDNKAPRLPNHWAYFGGAVEDNESPEEAVIREAKEELDYDLVNPKRVQMKKVPVNGYDVKSYLFIAKYDKTQELTLLEGQGMAWLTPDEARKLKMADIDLDTLEFLENLEKSRKYC